MSAPKFTLGPWHEIAAHDSVGGGELDHDENYREIFSDVPTSSPGGFLITGFISPANARLISAAPDMYAALEAIVAMDDHDFAGICVRASEYLERIESARAALAKARGEE